MKINLIVILAILCLVAFFETHAYHHHCKKKSCDAKKYFDYDRCDCRCKKHDECHRRQVWDKNSCSCKCPWYRNADNCINWEEFDVNRCKCYCPYSKHHKCPSNQFWDYENCYCKCIEPKKVCKFGERFSRSQCRCIVDTSIKTNMTLPPTNAPTLSTQITNVPTDSTVSNVPTIAPVTNAQTDAPVTNIPTNPTNDIPITNAPSDAPITETPTLAPITNFPTDAPVTNASTDAPVDDVTTLSPTTQNISSLPLDDQLAFIQADEKNLLLNQQYVDAIAQELVTTLIGKVQALLTDTTLIPEIINYLNDLLIALQNFNTQTSNNSRRKRQIVSNEYTCDSVSEEINGVENDRIIYTAELNALNTLANRFTSFLTSAINYNLTTIITDLDDFVKNRRSQVENKQKFIDNLDIKKNAAVALQAVLCANTLSTTPETIITPPILDPSTDAPNDTPTSTDISFDLSMLSNEDFAELESVLQTLIDGLKVNLPYLTEDDKIQVTNTISTIQGLLAEPKLSENVVTSMNSLLTSFQNILAQAN